LDELKSPQVIDNVLGVFDFNNLSSIAQNKSKTFHYDSGFGRFLAGESELPILKELSDSLVDLARKTFSSKTLLPTYSLFAHYEGDRSSLRKHFDDNACTYTIDLCLYQNFPWDLWVDNKNYTLHPNQALAYYGNDQEHWRETFPYPELQHVAMVFFHFAEPDHWWFTKGQSYLSVIRKEMTDLEWEQLNLGTGTSTA
jgi:hypothetical protein